MVQIEPLKNVNDEIACPKCNSNSIKKAGRKTGRNQSKCVNCGECFGENPGRLDAINVSPEQINPNEMRLYDRWDLRVLGKKPTTDGLYTLNFTGIRIAWLKLTIQDYLWARLAILKTSTLNKYLTCLKQFSEYLENVGIVKPQSINRQIVLGFFNYVSSQELSSVTRSRIITCLKDLLEFCQTHKPLEFSKNQLIFPEDYPKREKSQVKDLPSYVLKQLDDKICYLAKPAALQVKILRETGMRVSELCELKINCIQPDGDGDWWIDLVRGKMEKQNRLLITKELAQEILEQQKFIRNNLGSEFNFLFCSTEGRGWFEGYNDSDKETTEKQLNHFIPVAQKIRPNLVRGYLYYLAKEHKIRDVCGDIYPIWRCHQFRHTHLTDCARKGMGISHIMQRAGHSGPAMSLEYIHLTNEDQKQAMKEVWDNTHFNIEGKVVASPNPDLDTAALQWIKKGMNVQTSENGHCTLLFTQTCPDQNSPCKECGSWTTTLEYLSAHQKELEETEKIIENARVKGWQRQVEKNVPRAERLKKIIDGMKKHKTMKGLGHNDWEKEGDNDSK